MALAQLGHRPVIGVDISSRLLAEFAERTRSSPSIQAVRADIAGGLAGIVEVGTVQTAVCMGDTLTHLVDVDAVNRMFADIHRLLRPDGQFVVSFRDLAQPPQGLARFIPVHSDENTIMTCFLEDTGSDAVQVHDLIHRRTADGWVLSKGTYRKLKLGHAQVAEQLRGAGFAVAEPTLGPRRMWIVHARHTG
jgi:SAM-dependent methyltransferase